jgi:flagellar biosynthesis protein FliQ
MTGALTFIAGFVVCLALLVLLGRWIIRSIVG